MIAIMMLRLPPNFCATFSETRAPLLFGLRRSRTLSEKPTFHPSKASHPMITAVRRSVAFRWRIATGIMCSNPNDWT
jgi:hypothetical protein